MKRSRMDGWRNESRCRREKKRMRKICGNNEDLERERERKEE